MSKVRVQILSPVQLGKDIHKDGELDVTEEVAALWEGTGSARRLKSTTPASEPADESAGTDQSGSVSASVKAAAAVGAKKKA